MQWLAPAILGNKSNSCIPARSRRRARRKSITGCVYDMMRAAHTHANVVRDTRKRILPYARMLAASDTFGAVLFTEAAAAFPNAHAQCDPRASSGWPLPRARKGWASMLCYAVVGMTENHFDIFCVCVCVDVCSCVLFAVNVFAGECVFLCSKGKNAIFRWQVGDCRDQ